MFENSDHYRPVVMTSLLNNQYILTLEYCHLFSIKISSSDIYFVPSGRDENLSLLGLHSFFSARHRTVCQ